MKLRTETFRCDLCGKHKRIGVTETQPKWPDASGETGSTQTSICDVCIELASDLMSGGSESAEPESS